MALNSHTGPSSNSRSNQLSKLTTTQDRHPELWQDSNQKRDGFAHLLNGLAEKMSTDEAVNICLLTESIAGHFAYGYTTLQKGEITLDLARGHGDLNQLLAPTTLERAEAFELIKTPTIYDGWAERSQHRVARRTLWELGPTAKKYLDMQTIRGYDQDTTSLRSDANEGIVHRYILRLTEHVYRGKGKEVDTYVRADAVADIRDDLAAKVYDMVAYNDNGSIYATCEIEMRPLDRAHVANDARLQAALPGDSDWVVCRKEDVNRLLDTFVKDGAITLPNGHPGWGNALDLSTNNAMERLKRVVDSSDGSIPTLESPIITTVNTADNIRQIAQEVRPEIFSELNLDLSGVEQ